MLVLRIWILSKWACRIQFAVILQVLMAQIVTDELVKLSSHYDAEEGVSEPGKSVWLDEAFKGPIVFGPHLDVVVLQPGVPDDLTSVDTFSMANGA